MPIYGKGECLYGIEDECKLGDKGIEVDPIYCLNCVLLKLASAAEEIASNMQIFPQDEKDEDVESKLH